MDKAFKAIRSSYVKAGVLGTNAGHHDGGLTNAELASIHEFGLGNAPARPWIAPPFQKNRKRYLEFIRRGYADFLKTGDAEVFRKALALAGQLMVTDIRAGVTQGAGIPPPNAPATIARLISPNSMPIVKRQSRLDLALNRRLKGPEIHG